ncbi:hypothetical protein NQ315_002020 [Exocentrus adspersus]|uniref:Transposase n=1 Tax=Exocentrus adspersus TaxID=1586481 RepID=A0AAV8WA66_9CUCU|nr:hypothetical protein NQ315_002020 [Exocentrus adspersus]
MDPAVFMQGKIDLGTVGSYLGIDGRVTPELRAHHQRQGVKFLEHFELIPRKHTPANCPDCGVPLATTDRQRDAHEWTYVCINHLLQRKFAFLENTFLGGTFSYGQCSADKIVILLYAWYRQQPIMDLVVDLSLTSETVIYWYSIFRDIACAIAWHEFVPIGGVKDVVEVNVTQLTYNDMSDMDDIDIYTDSEERPTIWVVGGISRTTKKRFTLVVKSIDEDALLPLLQQCIDGNSYVCVGNKLSFIETEVVFSGCGERKNFIHPPKKGQRMWVPADRFNKECLDSKWKGPSPRPGVQPFRKHTHNLTKVWIDLKMHLKTLDNVALADQYIGEYMYRQNVLKEYGLRSKEGFIRFLHDINRVYPGIGRKGMKNRFENILDCNCHECNS